MNKQKIKLMTNLVLRQQITLDGDGIEEVNCYKYFGHEIRISQDNQICEIQH